MSEAVGCDHVRETEIDMEGVIPEREEAAVQEIRWLLQVLSMISKKVRVERVVVAKDFDATINKLLSVHKAYGIEYKAQRRSVRAIAKTLRHIENEKISFSLLFDGEVFGSWEERAKAFRFEKFLHELVHTILDNARFERVGAKDFYADARTAEGVCLSLALVTRNEYIVDRIVDELCQKCLTDEDHQPVRLAKLHLAEGVDFRPTLSELMETMPSFIGQNVRDFKLWRMTIDTLWPRMCQFVEELLTVFAHCAATHDRQEEWRRTLADISGTEAYRSFLSGHLEGIHREWQKWFDEPDRDEAVSLEAMQNEIREILRRCGLTLTNVSEGTYVEVDFIQGGR